MYTLQNNLQKTLSDIQQQGLFKKERIITTPQAVEIKAIPGGDVLNFCAIPG
jgi:glycine C-acetyltransferase